MLTVDQLPGLNATLNGMATICLTAGFILIKQGKKKAHRTAMVSALTLSIIFLFFYVLHKILVRGVHTAFAGDGFWNWVYYPMLISHIILAMVIVPLVIITLLHAFRGKFDRHRAWARWTFPLWYYVSVTGVLVYFFLYVWFQTPATA